MDGTLTNTGTSAGWSRRAHWMDDVLADSFPASDPPSWTPGLARPAPARTPSDASDAERSTVPAAGFVTGTRPVEEPT